MDRSLATEELQLSEKEISGVWSEYARPGEARVCALTPNREACVRQLRSSLSELAPSLTGERAEAMIERAWETGEARAPEGVLRVFKLSAAEMAAIEAERARAQRDG